MKKHILIMGGGVAGMSAAHELIERGFSVTIFEKAKELVGGKARSIPIPESAGSGKIQLPGEHGFRFFPGFYKNIVDTMERIPFKEEATGIWNKRGVADNLVACSSIMIARANQRSIVTPAHLPRTLGEVYRFIKNIFSLETGLPRNESRVIAQKIWQLMTSCDERWEEEYEQKSWWDFTDAPRYSAAYQKLFVSGLTRTLVAAKAETANTRTNGKILLQMIFNFSNRSVPVDRVLCGPTNERWLNPWYEYLTSNGLQYEFNHFVEKIDCDKTRITGVWVSKDNEPPKKYVADYYLCALPVERAAKILNPDMFAIDDSLRNIITLSRHVAWMNGIQFYLRKDVKLTEGHIILVDSEWALTAISQLQFWRNFDLRNYDHGEVGGIISVDVCNWEDNGVFGRPAKRCTKKQVIEDVWEQLKKSFNVMGSKILEDSNLYLAFIDDSIIFADDILEHGTRSPNKEMNEMSRYGSNQIISNEEPLLVNEPDTWKLRNEAKTGIPNLFLASDYVRNYTNLATMEGANEAARLAVNFILDAEKSPLQRCRVQPLEEPAWLNLFKAMDRIRYRSKKQWQPPQSLRSRTKI